MKEIIAVIAAVLALIGGIPYLRDVFRGKVQPHPYTWLVGTVVSAITFFGMLVKGAGIGALPTAVAEIFTVIIFITSLRYGFKEIPKTDSLFLVIALLGIIPWILTKDPTLSIIIAVTIDVVSFIPTIRKTWKYPASESPTIYFMNVARHILTIFSLQTYNIATTLHSIAMILINTCMTVLVVRKQKSSKAAVKTKTKEVSDPVTIQ